MPCVSLNFCLFEGGWKPSATPVAHPRSRWRGKPGTYSTACFLLALVSVPPERSCSGGACADAARTVVKSNLPNKSMIRMSIHRGHVLVSMVPYRRAVFGQPVHADSGNEREMAPAIPLLHLLEPWAPQDLLRQAHPVTASPCEAMRALNTPSHPGAYPRREEIPEFAADEFANQFAASRELIAT